MDDLRNRQRASLTRALDPSLVREAELDLLTGAVVEAGARTMRFPGHGAEIDQIVIPFHSNLQCHRCASCSDLRIERRRWKYSEYISQELLDLLTPPPQLWPDPHANAD